ncbi:ATP-binding protein [Caulobacter endophyticus]|uniref:histidine kinase n=1 Tax=Caulobacter endophyticus TaxID=2172652 RepID=A0A2T9JH20_9CAUL|nr:ATP-binding protein [Caulobacter endophyticus]PVM82978.1 histidine kinase [Caulobacter endophyticus]
MKRLIAQLRRPDAPIALRIVCLLVGSLVVAQLATLALTLLLPPKPPEQHSLADIAAGLRGAAIDTGSSRPLVRTIENEPPSLNSAGWVASERSSADLARLLNADPDDVRLLFYAPPPFAGAGGGALRQRAEASPSPITLLFTSYAQAQPMAGPGGMPRPMPGMRPPGAVGAQGFPAGSFSGAPTPGGAWRQGRIPQQGLARADYRPGGVIGDARPAMRPGEARPGQVAQGGPGQGGFGRPAGLGAGGSAIAGPPRVMPRLAQRLSADPLFTAPFRTSTFMAVSQPSEPVAAPPPQASPEPMAAHIVATPPPLTPRVRPLVETVTAAPSLAAPQALRPAVVAEAKPQPQGRALPAPTARGLFGLAPAPYIEGDFVAALRIADGRWVTLQPKPEGFPNSWQRRVLLWFLVSFAIVGPVGYLFARRLVAPLAGFADAAEALGRDPSSPVLAANGPAEIGRAARAFNQMQARLTRFINDRTAMIGAISHDLRTPLTRMRFRLERASPALRREIGQDIDQMEAMINSVLAFMRENAEAGARQHVDLRSLVECVVDDAEITGGDVVLEAGAAPQVEIDVLGLQRVFTNLVDNAVKYGDSARVRLYVDGDEAVTEIRDRGPGMSEDELGRVFTPFYRSVAARTSTKQGVGLGLATSRTTVRAHGGEIRLSNTGEGLMAQVRLPLAVQRGGAQEPPAMLEAAE